MTFYKCLIAEVIYLLTSISWIIAYYIHYEDNQIVHYVHFGIHEIGFVIITILFLLEAGKAFKNYIKKSLINSWISSILDIYSNLKNKGKNKNKTSKNDEFD